MRTAITLAILLSGAAILAHAQKKEGGVRGVIFQQEQVYEIRCDDPHFECWAAANVLHIRMAPQKWWPKE